MNPINYSWAGVWIYADGTLDALGNNTSNQESLKILFKKCSTNLMTFGKFP